MRLRSIVWLPLFVIALSVGLVVPKVVHARQDAAVTLQAGSGTAREPSAAVEVAELFTPGNISEPKAANGTPASAGEKENPSRDNAGMTPLDAILILSLIACNGLIILLGITLALRKGRRQIRGASAPYASAYRAL